jgi:F-type H+-transporting ATPase subunit O
MLDKVEAELTAFNEVVKKNNKMEQYLANPTVPRLEKSTKVRVNFLPFLFLFIFFPSFNQVGNLLDEKQFSYITRNLFHVLGANGRLGDATRVAREFSELMAAARGAVDVTIISAEPLKKNHLEAIQKAINSIVGAKKSVNMSQEVDPSILGGLQVLIGDRFLDLSVSSRVNDLSKTLDSAV